ncbi:MAG: NACHT domain-containing protein [Candidatus Hatepunaea meridiana]|nr:NACHT domain-containing protein [Candidatus Hatepunaea meridiana]
MLAETIAASVIVKIFIGTAIELGRIAVKDAKKVIKDEAEKKRYEKAAVEYSKNLLKLYGHVRVIGLNKPLPLEGVYTDVNILSRPTGNIPLPEHLAEAIFLGKAKFGDVKEEDKGREGKEVLRKYDKLFILGKPGAGKTTFLKHTMHQAIHGKLYDSPKRDVVPVFIELKKFSESELPILDYIVEQFDICRFTDAKPFIEKILTEGQVIILCDGLDEVMKEKRGKVIKDLTDLSNKYLECPFIITCRIAATDYSYEKFTYVEMADFNDQQIDTFVKNWFTTEGDVVKSDGFLKEFNQAKNKRLREIARTPLLLAMMCLSYSEHQTFPSRHSQVYSQAIDALLYKW